MKCEVCGAAIPEGKAECPNCGYPVIVSLGNNPLAEDQKKAAAEKYRQQICRDIEVGFYAYRHTVIKSKDGSEKLSPAGKPDEVSLGHCGALKDGQTIWYPEAFLRPKRDELKCSIYIRRDSEEEISRELRFGVSSCSSYLHIGVKKISTDVIRIVLKDNGSYQEESGDISVLRV